MFTSILEKVRRRRAKAVTMLKLAQLELEDVMYYVDNLVEIKSRRLADLGEEVQRLEFEVEDLTTEKTHARLQAAQVKRLIGEEK